MPGDSPGLYGITPENSSRSGADLWGKNQFNSTFPLALCLYMRDQGLQPISVVLDGGQFVRDEGRWAMGQVVGEAEDHPCYHFEAAYEPYENLSTKGTDKIDLVVAVNGSHCQPLEVKLTVTPDSETAQLPEDSWAPEIVIRPVTSAYAMMGVTQSLRTDEACKSSALRAIRRAYDAISSSGWNNPTEIESNRELLCDSLSEALAIAEPLQKPFLLQPVWRTLGQSLALSEQCLDVFVWSDVAMVQLPIIPGRLHNPRGISRSTREVARHVQAMRQLLLGEAYDYEGIYKGDGLGTQTDKSFAMPGRTSRDYMEHEVLDAPRLPPSVLQEVILGNGHLQLKPERRFDAAVLLYSTDS